MPIRARLTVWYASVFALILTLVGAFLITQMQASLVGGVDQSLATRAAQISLGLNGSCNGQFQDVADATLAGLPQGESGAQLLSPTGSVMDSTGDSIMATDVIPQAALDAAIQGRPQNLSTTLGGEPFRVLAVSLPPGACRGSIVVATSLSQVTASVNRLLRLLLLAGPAAIAAAAFGGWLLARKSLAPVSDMTLAAAEIGAGNPDERISLPPTSDELQRLAVTLNAMLDRVQQGADQQRQFVADASHELRTPLAIMGAELDVSLRSEHLTPEAREVLLSSRQEVGRMSRIVTNLLVAGQVGEPSATRLRTHVDLRALAQRICDSMRSLAEQKEIVIQLSGDGVVVNGDRERLEQVLVNLIENAIKYSGKGSEVRVAVWHDGELAGLTVADDGPGVPSPAQLHIFDRFFRADSPRARTSESGTGLGLAISRQIVEAHGGRIWVESSPAEGSSFSFSLPRALDEALIE